MRSRKSILFWVFRRPCLTFVLYRTPYQTPYAMPPLISITYPEPDFKIRTREGTQQIWDRVRKIFTALTPEEWVRQNFLGYLIRSLGYPPSLMAVEKEIRLGALHKRCDIVVYRASAPWLIVECKEPSVPLSEKVLSQILAYNMTLDVPYLVLTNGNQTCAVSRKDVAVAFLEELPAFHEAPEGA